MSPGDKEELKRTRKEKLSIYHFSLGLYIRNNFGLLHGNDALIKSCGMAKVKQMPGFELDEDYLLITHPDDCSGVIIDALWERLQES
jgi:hypothetical protein